ncbi:DUF4340 domain-containing protein [Spirulina sp. CS-785/01]|uniref:DUF4340 domain-containing protein n=1 Tax=Spirulina sp. CS-785/01 TaxID=3021716 RepID=UPI00232CEEA2|nr:DUF4340 domain-containing protein [Spirulina sp. CS-785/01]MDB9315182.1 DUF4340 domain-containing protein [Spirulina sp. CS-785/01]
MKLQKTTWVLLVIALLLGGGVYFYEMVAKPQQEEVKAQQSRIFDVTEDEVTGLIIEREEEETLELQRTPDEEIPWQMTQPEERPASPGTVTFLLNLLEEGERDRTFLIAPDEQDDYGLEDPFAEITIFVREQSDPYRIVIGDENFEGKLVYALINPEQSETQELEVMLIPIDFKYAVDRELEEWQQANNE